MPASGAYVGLALPGELGSWQNESKVHSHLIILQIAHAFFFPIIIVIRYSRSIGSFSNLKYRVS